ncbi:unnamed protein product [Closterium sp. NIES-53]
MAWHDGDDLLGRHEHAITHAGLDRFFQRCTQLEQLSLLCLHRDAVLPPSFFHLTRLHTLSLTAASALEAPHLGSLASLTTLHIAATELSEEQLANVRRLPSITNLSLSARTTFSPRDPGLAAFMISELPLIKSLRIRHLWLSELPCTSVERLHISDCDELRHLPDHIDELLPRLRHLTISACRRLEELPESFCSLEHLETLSLFKCGQFRRLPENIGSLCALRALLLEELSLSSLPDSVCQLTSLHTFSLLACRPICELPAEFACLTALTTLCLGHVPLPSHIGRLCNLHTLLVTASFWQWFFPPSLSHLSSLTTLVLHGCGVHELPEGVGQLTNLRHLLVLSCPHLTALPASLTRLTRLEALTLSACENLASAPTRWDGLTRLKRLEMVGACDVLKRPHHVLPPSIETLIWGGNEHTVPLPHVSRLMGLRSLCLVRVAVACGAGVSTSLPHLEHLTLHLPDDADELPFPLACLSRLRALAIHGGRSLQRLPADIGTALPQLRTLVLRSVGELRELPASVSVLQHLTSLTVDSAPKLASLPPGIAALSSLQELQLISCEQLEHVPVALAHLTRLD